MKPLTTRITEARDIAVEREADIRIQEFLRAIIVTNWQMAVDSQPDTHAPERLELSVDCHFRSWRKSIRAEEAARLAVMTPNELSRTIAGWVQDAIKQGLLLLSNPPRDRPTDPTIYAVGGVLTYMFDPDGNLVGTRWGPGR